MFSHYKSACSTPTELIFHTHYIAIYVKICYYLARLVNIRNAAVKEDNIYDSSKYVSS